MSFVYSNWTLGKMLLNAHHGVYTDAELQPLVDEGYLLIRAINPRAYRDTKKATDHRRSYVLGQFNHESVHEDEDNILRKDGWTTVYSDEYMAKRQGQLFPLADQKHVL